MNTGDRATHMFLICLCQKLFAVISLAVLAEVLKIWGKINYKLIETQPRDNIPLQGRKALGLGFHCSGHSVFNLLPYISKEPCKMAAKAEVPTSHGFSFHPNRRWDFRAIWLTFCSIPWRSGEQNQQHQWRMALQILSLPIHWNSHPARQCFVLHGNYRINGKTWRTELLIISWLNEALAAHWNL